MSHKLNDQQASLRMFIAILLGADVSLVAFYFNAPPGPGSNATLAGLVFLSALALYLILRLLINNLQYKE